MTNSPSRTGPSRSYLEPVADFVLCDRDQDRNIAALGQVRSPFSGVSRWPWLETLLAARSNAILKEVGEDPWRKQGGTYDRESGQPTFRKNAPAVSRIVQELAEREGGLLYRDGQGISWAVRLLSDPDQEVGVGLAITWHNNPLLTDGAARDASLKEIRRQQKAADQQDQRHLGQFARQLRLYSRAEQAFWLLYTAVRNQRSSTVVLPDETLAQAVWGGRRRPKNWRQHLFDVLTSLSGLRVERLHITRGGWSPRLDLHSVAVASVKRLEATRVEVCQVPGCPLEGSRASHGHFMVQVGLGFLGVLENYATGSEDGTRRYDFAKTPSEEAGKKVRAAQKEGALVTVSLPVKLFGRAAWSSLTAAQQRIIQALVREVTRPAGTAKPSQRDDGAEVIRGNRVPGGRRKHKVPCALLDPEGTYVAFNGNGVRRGQGYKIVGDGGKGWLWRCGYPVPKDLRALRQEIRQFLADLEAVAGILGLTVVGRGGGRWWATLKSLRGIARRGHGDRTLAGYLVRVYGPPDYPDRLRRFLEVQGKMRIPKPDEAAEARGEAARTETAAPFRLRMHEAGVTQRELAGHLGCSQQFVAQILGKRRAWPPGMQDKADAYLRQQEKG
jgi:hypothetical protein